MATTKPPENPYLAARQEWNERYGSYVSAAASWRFAAITAQMEASIIPGAGVPADQLTFAFQVSGSARWRPTRIYSDGLKTYIQFPSAVTGQDAPVLFVVSGGQNRIVNYRMNGAMMVVDYYVDHAILVSGVGSKQQKITIRREG
jgi:P-type conjugative transfer protein TrbG